ncbi:MAG: protein TolA, partial [Gemmatimonadetes bacterium]|nr:protein TolA [Gemmatimonadota bacterium]
MQNFLLFSFLIHVGLTVALILVPELRRGPRIPPDATVVELVGAVPGSRPAPVVTTPAPRPEPPPPPPPKEGVTVQSEEPEPAPEKKPEKETAEEPPP